MKKNAPPSAASPLPLWPLAVITGAAPFAAGIFFEYGSAALAVCLIAWLWYCGRRGGLSLRLGLTLIASAVTALFYLLGCLWGVDKGMALVGFEKFLPLPLYAASIAQLEPDGRARIIRLLPIEAAGMVLGSLLLGLIPALREYFYVNGRLAGFFEYPNTFALYAILGIPVLADAGRWDIKDIACLAVLLAGVALSGSRAAMVVLAGVVLACALLFPGRRGRILLPSLFVLTLAAAALYSRVSGDVSAAGRYLTTSAGASTFLGRLLYWRDALPQIAKHPLGLGYLGYWFRQGSFQTGVYSVMHIHNDLLQFLLDVGWIPAALLIWAVIRGFRRADRASKVMIAAMAAHLIWDFDMQFIAMDLILLLLIYHNDGEGRRLAPPRAVWMAAGGILAALCLYIGAASALFYAGGFTAGAALYPGYTQAQMQALAAQTELSEAGKLADSILSHNESVSLAWDARARVEYSAGDMGAMIDCKRNAIALSRYDLSEYLDYADMLVSAEQLYEAAGDSASAAYCRAELAAIPGMLADVLDGTSALGWKISDQPALDLPAGYEWLYSLAG